jgi:antitoxin ParD1/3/4
MSARANKPITVTLGGLAERAEARVKAGAYSSISEVVRAGLRALDREEEMLDALLKSRVQEVLAERRPPIPAAEVSAELRRHHEARLKRGA